MTFRNLTSFFLLSILCLLLTGFVCREEFSKKREARGVWLSRWEYTSHLDNRTPQAQQQKIIEVMRLARKAKLNFIFFQVRGQCDAFYRSQLEPWAAELTGRLGQEPGWDPLLFAVKTAHRHGLELHAWLNTFSCWKGKQPPPHSTPEHVYHSHPEWLCADKQGKPMTLGDHYIYLSPGIPAVRRHVHQVAMELVNNYNIDGIHFDYIRYPENAKAAGYSHDVISVQRFRSANGNPRQLAWADWQREQINIFLNNFYHKAIQQKPMLKISAAVLGKGDESPTGSFHVVFQDSRRWLQAGCVDFLVPMIYWRRGHPTASFDRLAQNWIQSNATDRLIIPGIGTYKYNRPDWSANEIQEQVDICRRLGAQGVAFFSYSSFKEILKIGNYQFKHPAILPALPWKDAIPPLTPTNLKVMQQTGRQVALSWSAPLPATDGDAAARYIVYRTPVSYLDPGNARYILDITPYGERSYIDRTVEPGKHYYYVVSALDNGNNESPLSEAAYAEIPYSIASGAN